MSESSKFPFDSIPLDGGGTADAPRPAFSRSVPEMSSAGLLPPTRKPVAVTLPDPTPLTPPAVEPNPMASTPPPKAGSVRGFLWDLIRPTRTKWAILAGGVSLLAGAYGLNLFVPAPGEGPKAQLPETAKLTGPSPRVVDERQRPPSVDEQRTAALPPKETAPAPLAPLPAPTPSPIIPVRHDEPVAPPLPSPVPLKPDDRIPPVAPPPASGDKLPSASLPAPAFAEKIEPVMPTPLSQLNHEQPAATPLPVPKAVPDKPAEVAPLPKLVMPIALEPKPAEAPVPLPKVGFVETPDPTKKPDALPIKPDPIPALPAPDMKLLPAGDNKSQPEVKLPPLGDPRPLPAPPLPAVGGTVDSPKPADPLPAPKPVDPTPIPFKPHPVAPKPLDMVPPPPVVPIAEKKTDPILAPVFKEEKPAVGTVPVTGGKEPAPVVPVTAPPPKKGFEVDVVKVRPTDTYTSISEAFYQSRKYATALRAFNGDVDIGRLQEVEVPPLFELQKQVGMPAREAEPTIGGGRVIIPARNATPAEPAVRGPVLDPSGDAGETADWGPAGKKRPVIKYERFTTPKEGMTLRDVAKAVYADENEWTKLMGPRGAKLRADDRLPRGTELTVPREELPWK